jgi:hypothetical protein
VALWTCLDMAQSFCTVLMRFVWAVWVVVVILFGSCLVPVFGCFQGGNPWARWVNTW